MTASPTMQGSTPVASRHLYRRRANREIAGVCAGVAEYLGADTNAIRFLTILLAVLTGVIPMLVLYLVAAVIIPEASDEPMAAPAQPVARQSATPADRRQRHLFVGLLLMVIGIVALANETLHIEWDLVWPVALVALGGVVLLVAPRR
jgi:phage shock protein PspC (stress-responsive transcriptional regulator)